METLALKLNVLAGLFGFIGLFGLVLLLASLIWLIIRVANFDSVLPALLCVLLSIALTAGGLVLSPAPHAQVEPLRPPWEAPLEALKGQIGKLRDNGPWARLLKGGEAAGGETLPEMERMEVIRTSAPEQEDWGREGAGEAEPAPKAENPPEDGGAEPAAPEQSRILIDEVISGWRVRLTLPREWKDACVVENNGTYLSFTQKASMADYGGELFSLSVAESPVDFESEDYIFRDCEIVTEKEGMALVLTGPTDIPATDETMDEYVRMYDDIRGDGGYGSILSTVEFERA